MGRLRRPGTSQGQDRDAVAPQVGFEPIPPEGCATANGRMAVISLTLLTWVPYRLCHDEIVLCIAGILSSASIAAGHSSMVFRCP